MAQHILVYSLTGIALLLLAQCSFGELTTSSSLTSDVADQCICKFNAPPVVVCTEYDAEYLSTISRVQDKIANLTSQVDYYEYEWEQLEGRIRDVDRKMSKLTSACLTMEERTAGIDKYDQRNFDEITKQLFTLEQVLSNVKYDETYNDIMQAIDNKLENLTRMVDIMSSDKVERQDAEIMKQAEEFEAELEECRQQPSDIKTLLTVSQWPQQGSQETCKKLSQILQPFTVRRANASTIWFADPVNDQQAIWLGTFDVKRCSYSDMYYCRQERYNRITGSSLQRYNTTQMFEHSDTNLVTYYLPNRIENTAAVAYNGYLYFIRYNTRILVKFNIDANSTATTKTLPADVGMGNDYPYTVDGHSSIDLDVDESGLWMIYSTTGNHGLIVLSKLNATSLEITDTWFGNFPKKFLGNCFIACGTLYYVSSHDSHNAKVNYYYDTNANDEGFMNIPFDAKYGLIKSLNYNPFDQKLYALDNGHAVVYDLIFG